MMHWIRGRWAGEDLAHATSGLQILDPVPPQASVHPHQRAPEDHAAPCGRSIGLGHVVERLCDGGGKNQDAQAREPHRGLFANGSGGGFVDESAGDGQQEEEPDVVVGSGRTAKGQGA